MPSNAGTRIIRVAFWGIVCQIGSAYGHDVGPHRHLYMLRLPKGHTTQERFTKAILHLPLGSGDPSKSMDYPTLSCAAYESYLLFAISVPLGHLSKSLSTQGDKVPTLIPAP